MSVVYDRESNVSDVQMRILSSQGPDQTIRSEEERKNEKKILINVAIEKPNQIVAFVQMHPYETLADLKAKVVEEVPRFAQQCKWEEEAEKQMGDNKGTRAGLGADGERMIEEEPEYCFYFHDAPVSKVQEKIIHCLDVSPTVCVGKRRTFHFTRHGSDARGSSSQIGNHTVGRNSPSIRGADGLAFISDMNLASHPPPNRNAGGDEEPGDEEAIELQDFADITRAVEEHDLEADVKICVLCEGKLAKSWQGKSVRGFVSALRAGSITPSNSVRNLEDLGLESGTTTTTRGRGGRGEGAEGEEKGKGGLISPITTNASDRVNSDSRREGASSLSTDEVVRESEPLSDVKGGARNGPSLNGGGARVPRGKNQKAHPRPLIENGDIVLDGKSIRDRLKLSKGSWVDITVQKRDAVLWLCRALGLHPLTIEDILEEQREKIEVLEEYTFINLNALMPKQMIRDLRARGETPDTDFMPLRMLLYKDVLITIHPWRGLFARIQKALPTLRRERKSAIAKVAYFIMDSETEAFVPHVERLMSEVDALEDLVYSLSVSEREDLLKRISLCRRLIAQLNQVIWSKAMIFQQLKSARNRMEMAQILPVVYVQDILDTITFMTTRLKLAREFLDGAQATYLARVSVEAADHSSEIEGKMSTLSSVATIFVPLTTITGMWGMNVVVPGQVEDFDPDDAREYIPFILICSGMVFLTMVISMCFRKLDLF